MQRSQDLGVAFTFASKVAATQREALEQLLFFNGCQHRVARQIENAIDRYGTPEIVNDAECLRVRISGQNEVQSLFLVEPQTGRPVGVAVYLRPDLEHVTVLHLGIAEEFCAGGARGGLGLLLQLMREVRRSSRRIKGVRHVRTLYATERARAGA
jgi:hypothetical protein